MIDCMLDSFVYEDGSYSTDDDTLVICIDPGHGGDEEGAKREYDGRMVYEKDIDLEIALYLRDYLEEYYNVDVVMTRYDDTGVSNTSRPELAKAQGADYYISIHNNAPYDEAASYTGCMVLVSCSHYQPADTTVPNLYYTEERLATGIIASLGNMGIGISNDFEASLTNGLLRRPYSPEGKAKSTKTYPDGSVADYYGQIRLCTEKGIPAIIIEHAYITTDTDYRSFLCSSEKRAALARADADAIASCLHLTK